MKTIKIFMAIVVLSVGFGLLIGCKTGGINKNTSGYYGYTNGLSGPPNRAD